MSQLWEQLDPGFLAPIWLGLGLIAVVAVILLEVGAERHRRKALRAFVSPHLLAALTGNISIFKRVLKRVLLVLAVALLFLAMARPHLFFRWSEEERTGLDVLIAVDCSKSMLTQDAKPNRLGRAQLAVEDFAAHLPGNRLGLIAFAGDAFLECPLTLDHDAFLSALRDLDTDTIPRPGTDIASAINEGVVALKSQPNNLKFMILITDGEDLEGRAFDAAKAAAQAGLRLYTVGVGTPLGGPIPVQDENGGTAYLRDSTGELVQSRLDENALRQMAEITGGAYQPLGDRGEGLEALYHRYIEPLPKQHLEEKREKIPFEWFEWPLAAAILLLAWEFLVQERIRSATPSPLVPVRSPRRMAARVPAGVPVLTCALLVGSLVGGRAATTDTAEREYKSGQYEDAAQKYRDATRTEPNRRDLEYDRGDAAYKAGEYNEAEEAFRKALETPDLKLQDDSYYNLGNTQFKHGEALEKVDKQKARQLWEQSLHSYESALKLKDAADTRHNYEVVKKKLEELKKQQQQQKDDQKKDGDQSQQGQGQSQGQSGKGPDQDKNQGQDPNQKGNQPDNNGRDQSQQGNQPQDQPGNIDGDRQKDQSGGGNQKMTQGSARSRARDKDQEDPGIKNQQEAEALLDSTKDNEHRVSARSLNGDNVPPPTASGKDW